MTDRILSDAQAIIEAARAAMIVHDIEGVPAVLLPSGGKLELVQELRNTPGNHIISTVYHDTLESFLRYVGEHATPETAVAFSLRHNRLHAILDYHFKANAPDVDTPMANWASHHAFLNLPFSDEWECWYEQSGTAMEQEQFAEFIEDHQPEITAPDGATMLEIASSLQIARGSNFRRATRLSNGEVQFEYHEDINSTAGRSGNLTIPEVIQLRLPVFDYGEHVTQLARFRYRLREGVLKLRLDLVRPSDTVRAAQMMVCQQAVDALSAMTPPVTFFQGEFERD